MFVLINFSILCQLYIALSKPCNSQNSCTCYKRDLVNVLNDDRPPSWKVTETFFSNSYNISHAIKPPGSRPANLMKIKVNLYNNSSNSTRSLDYIWTTSAVYTILPKLSLGLVSLGTLVPKITHLEISVYDFCHEVPNDVREKFLESTLYSLQDLSIISKSTDPRLNTARVVFKDVEGKPDNVFGNFNLAIMVLTLLSTFCAFGVMVCAVKAYSCVIEEPLINAGRFLFVVDMGFLFVIFLVAIIDLHCTSDVIPGHKTNLKILITSAFFLFVSNLVKVFDYVYKCCGEIEEDREGFIKAWSVGIVYHVIWVIIGLITNPHWTFPILFLILTVTVFIFYLAYEIRELGILASHFFFVSCAICTYACFGVTLGFAAHLVLSDGIMLSVVQALVVIAITLARKFVKENFGNGSGNKTSTVV